MSPVTSTPGAAGWKPDPWGQSAWRWWDGTAWTAHTHGPVTHQLERTRDPILPAWLSWPVVLCFLPALAITIYTGSDQPWSFLGALVPMVWVLPVLLWLDRLEPEPATARVHALLWGSTVAVVIGVVANGVALSAFGTNIASIVSAPIAEEIGKGLAIIMALRRHQVDSVSDGLVYAGWSALGFAVIEDVTYLGTAEPGSFIPILIARTVLTPFAHPLMTAWTGLAIGLAVRRGRSLWWAWWGWALAMFIHSLWNGSLVVAESMAAEELTSNLLLLVIAGFVLLFLLSGVMLVAVRRDESNQYRKVLPHLVSRYGLSEREQQIFASQASMQAARRALPAEQRAAFDSFHTTLARLAELARRPQDLGGPQEQRLVHNLRESRRHWQFVRS